MICPHCNKNTDEFYVRITKVSRPSFWYANHIGDVFRVFDYSEYDYRLVEGAYIDKKDAELVVVVAK